MKIKTLVGIVAASFAVFAVGGCSSTPKAEGTSKACCAKCPAGCTCGGNGACCKS